MNRHSGRGKLALVLSAGGARGAYEAGVIHYMRSALPKKVRRVHFPIQCGTSVGAINTLAMAAMAHDPEAQGQILERVWLSLRPEDIYRRDFSATAHFLATTLGGVLNNLLIYDPFKIGKKIGPRFHSFLDTRPLKKFLRRSIPFAQISKAVSKGPIDAIAVIATNIVKGPTEIFLQKKRGLEYRGNYRVREEVLGVDHAMASSAIPIIFPTIRIGKYYYADGGLRIFTPTSPAIQLGADRMVVVELRHRPSRNDEPEKTQRPAKEPTIAQQMGRLLNGVFLDRVEHDVEQLKRVNNLLDAGEEICGKNFVPKINAALKKRKTQEEKFSPQLRPIEVLEIYPSEFLSQIFMKWFQSARKGNFRFSGFEKLMIRLLDIDPVSGQDLLSYLMFAPEYLKELFELGYRDAEQKRQKLVQIMEN